ncbi:hypothetical protein Sango_2859200 [Sesamum angolense]|uniref:Myb/SANT-like domain-containing protein n=1 Tax=Sesamum angolense TaxID=2727404 RepID=A0AAE1T7G0_9LAMI|nr:hypothetical protein Sango_2859200 [Sesamum angolense]
MNLFDEEGTSKPRGCRAKADKGSTRRTWTQREKEVLVNALRTIVTTRWKCENGFRAGYLNQLEAIMCKQLPNTDIRAEPHINSKIHVWKKHYGTLMCMMGKSGFGWDDSRSMITVDSQDVWDEYCKIDASARVMRYKSWPYFPAWREIFGKDRAIGKVIVEAHPKGNEADTVADAEMHGYYVPTVEWCPGVGYVGNDSGTFGDIHENVDRNVTSTVSQKKPTSSGKKRKKINTHTDDGLTDGVNTFCDAANQRLSEISKKLFMDYEEVEKRSAVFAAVGSIPGIDLNEQIFISDRLVENPKKMDLFFSLPDDARARMVALMLSGKV